MKRLAAQNGGRAAEERGVPLVEAALDDAVEHLVLARHLVEGPQIALERIGIEEEVRRLDEEELRIVLEIADGFEQEVARRRMVGIEDRDQFAVRMLHAVVEIAGLGMFVAVARQIVDAKIGAELSVSSLCRATAAWASSSLSELRFCSVPPSSSSQTCSFSAG